MVASCAAEKAGLKPKYLGTQEVVNNYMHRKTAERSLVSYTFLRRKRSYGRVNQSRAKFKSSRSQPSTLTSACMRSRTSPRASTSHDTFDMLFGDQDMCCWNSRSAQTDVHIMHKGYVDLRDPAATE